MVILRRLNASRALRLQSFAKTLGQQSIRERLDAFREQSEDGRGFDDSEVRTGYCWSSCLCRNKSEPILFCRDKEADPGRVGKSSTSPSDAITLRTPLKIAARPSLSAISTLPKPEPMRLGATAKFDQVGWAG